MVTAATALAAPGFAAQSLSATREQISLSEQGQITDRYTKAIDQLGTQGAEHLQTRLGGIYALERIDEPTCSTPARESCQSSPGSPTSPWDLARSDMT